MGAPIIRIGDLDINQDLPVQILTWNIQRAGWAAMGFIVVLALAGLFGHGPISQVREGSLQEGLQIEYERFGRQQSPASVRISARPEREGGLSIWIDHSYLSHMEIQHMVPLPERATFVDGGVRFEWRTDTREPAMVTFYLQPQMVGALSGVVRASGQASVQIHQFIYP
jgi:hypothetical protein